MRLAPVFIVRLRKEVFSVLLATSSPFSRAQVFQSFRRLPTEEQNARVVETLGRSSLDTLHHAINGAAPPYLVPYSAQDTRARRERGFTLMEKGGSRHGCLSSWCAPSRCVAANDLRVAHRGAHCVRSPTASLATPRSHRKSYHGPLVITVDAQYSPYGHLDSAPALETRRGARVMLVRRSLLSLNSMP